MLKSRSKLCGNQDMEEGRSPRRTSSYPKHNSLDDMDLKKKQNVPYWNFNRRRMFDIVFLGGTMVMFLLSASGYHRRQLRHRVNKTIDGPRSELYKMKTRRQRREYYKRASHVLAQVQDLPHDMEAILQKQQEEEREAIVKAEMALIPHSLDDVNREEDEDEKSLVDWMANTLGEAVETAGQLARDTVQGIVGDELTDSVAESVSSTLDSVGEWVDMTWDDVENESDSEIDEINTYPDNENESDSLDESMWDMSLNEIDELMVQRGTDDTLWYGQENMDDDNEELEDMYENKA